MTVAAFVLALTAAGLALFAIVLALGAAAVVKQHEKDKH